MLFGALGPLMVTDVSKRVLELGAPLQRSLLALLLLRRREVVSTEQIIDALWNESPPKAAVTSVQTYVSNLRRVLEPNRDRRQAPELLVSGGAGYRLVCDDAATDVGRFESSASAGIQALDAGRPDEALDASTAAASHWRGEPYPELGSLDVAVFERSRLMELRRVVDETHAAALVLAGRDAEAVVRLEHLVREAPLRERRWELYITALYRSGRQADALRAYTRAREELVGQLGIEPSAELRRLEQRVIDQDPALLLASAPDPAPRATGGVSVEHAVGTAVPRLVGRDAPLSRLRSAGAVATSGVVRLSLVSGEAGIGKSALVEAYAAEVEAAGGRVWWARCLDTVGAPALWPWVQIARALVAADPSVATALRDLLPEMSDDQPAAAAPAELAGVRFRIFDALTRALGAAAGRASITVVLEDIHWADAATLEMLGFLVDSRLRTALHLLVTLRVDESPTDALRDVLGRIARSSTVDRIVLGGLRPTEIVEFARAVGGREVTETEAAALHAKTDGNPFFLAELTRLLAERDTGESLAFASGIPDAVWDVVVRRLGVTDQRLTDLLRVAAVAGERFHPEVVMRAASLAPDEALRLFEVGESLHWLLRPRPGASEIRFTHALARDVVLAEQTVAQRERSHWAIGMAMLDVYGELDGEHVTEIASHLAAGVAAGSVATAIGVARRAAELATRRQAHDEAAGNWRLAEQLLAARPADREGLMRVRLALGESLRLSGDWAGARQTFFRALDDAESLDRPLLIAEAAVAFRTMWLWTWREHGVTDQRMVRALRTCLPAVRDDPRMEALVLGHLGVELFYVDREEGLRLGEEALAIAERMDDDVLLLETLRALHLSLKSPEHLHRRIGIADRLVDVAARLGNPEHEAHALVDRSFLLLQIAHPDAWAEHQRARRLTESLHEPMMIAHVRQHAAVWAYLRGELDDAERLSDLAHRTHGRSGFWNTAAVHEMAQVLYHHERGTLREHLAVHPVVSPNGSSPITQPIIDIAWAYGALLLGDVDEARRLLTPRPVLRRGSSWLMMMFLHAVTGAAVGAPGLSELYEEIVPFAGRVAIGSEGPSTMGVIDHALGVLADALGDRTAARAWFERAVELNARLGDGPPTRASRAALAALDVRP